MSILSCRDLGVDVSGESLFRGVTFSLEKGEKAGLVGPNGAGKTTLLRTCLGKTSIESGEAQIFGSTGYLPQTAVLEGDETVFESMLKERTDLLSLREKLRRLEEDMAKDSNEKIMEKYVALTEKFEREGGYSLEALIRKILVGLGLEEQFMTVVSKLSGGQKTRLALSKLLLRAPDLLVLDEPTNHLDIGAMEWLENYLKDYQGAVLVVSHDRYFLDRIVSKIFLLENGCLKVYSGNFSEYELQRANEEKTLAREAERMAKKISRLEEYIRRNKAGVNARQARGREAQLKKLNPVDMKNHKNRLGISLETVQRSGDRVLSVENMSLSFPDRALFRNVNFELRRGDSVALLGKNGIGKTSFLKAVMDKIPYQGTIRLGANVSVAYYSQEHEDLDDRGTVFDEILRVSDLNDSEIRNLLAKYGFRGEDVFKPVSILSGGEKSRLALCKLFLAKGNLLLLDEPTNHLDTGTREVLEEALMDYEGTILIVSHDRYFLDKVIEKIAKLTPEGILVFEGDYTSFRESETAIEEEENGNKEIKLQEDRREEARNARKKQKRIDNLEEEITKLEEKLKNLEEELHTSAANYEKAMELHESYEKTKKLLDEVMETWLEECN